MISLQIESLITVSRYSSEMEIETEIEGDT